MIYSNLLSFSLVTHLYVSLLETKTMNSVHFLPAITNHVLLCLSILIPPLCNVSLCIKLFIGQVSSNI